MYARLISFAVLASCLVSGCGPSLSVSATRTFQSDFPYARCNVPPTGWEASDRPHIDLEVVCDCNTKKPLSVGIVSPEESRTKMVGRSISLQKNIASHFKTPSFKIPNRDGAEVTVAVSVACDDGSDAHTTVSCPFRKP